jgi:hypothetical protein
VPPIGVSSATVQLRFLIKDTDPMVSPVSHDPNFWAAAATLKRTQETKLCLAASNSDPCRDGIVAAHTIPRSQLRLIAENGHVYALAGSLPIFQKTEGKLKIAKKGIGTFSVLHCFCGYHDVTLFSPVENRLLTFTSEQIAILHYRAVAAELYRKMTGLTGFEETIANALKASTVKNTPARRAFARSHIRGTKLGLVDVGRTFKSCEDALFNQQYGDIYALVIRFRKCPVLMSVGAFSPEYDYNAKRMQDLSDAATHCDQVSLSIVASYGKAAVVMAWLKTATAPRHLAESLIQQRHEHITTLIIQTVFEHLENTCMNISWWDHLRPIERKVLTERMEVAMNPMEKRLSSALTYSGVTIDDWEYEDHQFVSV